MISLRTANTHKTSMEGGHAVRGSDTPAEQKLLAEARTAALGI